MHCSVEGIKFHPFSARGKAIEHAQKYCAPVSFVKECKSGGFMIQTPDSLVDDAAASMASPVAFTQSIADQLFI